MKDRPTFQIEGDPVPRDDESFAVVLSGPLEELPPLGVLAEVAVPDQMGGAEPAETTDPIVVLLYVLLRDHILPGTIEQRTMEVEQAAERRTYAWSLTNGFLAAYATNVLERLGQAGEEGREAEQQRLRQGEAHVAALLRAERVSESDRVTDRNDAELWLSHGRPF